MSNIKHGLRYSRIYTIWCCIKGRCYNSNNKRYKDYGAKGITMCDEWKSNFMNFYNWSMKNDYAENLTIDRINNNGNYEPTNCRWTDYKTQNDNRSISLSLTYDDKTMSINDWSKLLGVKYNTIRTRYYKGWSVEECLFGKSDKQ